MAYQNISSSNFALFCIVEPKLNASANFDWDDVTLSCITECFTTESIKIFMHFCEAISDHDHKRIKGELQLDWKMCMKVFQLE